jgi:hypothetical protein
LVVAGNAWSNYGKSAGLNCSLAVTLAGIYFCADMDTSSEPRIVKNMLIINMDVKDNHEEDGVGAKLVLDLCQKVLKQHNTYSVHTFH